MPQENVYHSALLYYEGKEYLFPLMASLLKATTFASCENKNHNDNKTFNHVGKQRIVIGDDKDSIPQTINTSIDEQVRIHLSFRTDNTCSMTMPAQNERRNDTYTLIGDKFDITINEIECPSPSWSPPQQRPPQSLRSIADFEEWCTRWADEVHMSITINHDEHNHIKLNRLGNSQLFFSHSEFDKIGRMLTSSIARLIDNQPGQNNYYFLTAEE